MPKQSTFVRVGKLFLKEVFEEVRRMVKRLDSKVKESDRKTIREFTYRFNTDKEPKDFFRPFYVTKLMKAGSMRVKEDGVERSAKFVSIFGFLRKLFLGILSGNPRTGYLSRRVEKYKKTKEDVELFESFIRIYRDTIGFEKRSLQRHLLASANVFSACEQKPKNLCLPPKCQYIRHTHRSKGYCRTKKTRKNRKRP